MTQSNFEKNGGTYTNVGDYLIPDLTLPPEEQNVNLGVFGMRHKRYLMENQRVTFNIMQMNGTLWKHLTDIDMQAEKMFLRLVNDMAKFEGVTEKLKAENQMLWVQKMNNIRNRATEIVNAELIYA